MASVYEDQQVAQPPPPGPPRPVSGPLPLPRPDRQAAQIFGEDPILYDRFRPGYPRELMEAVVESTGRGPVLEIGAGTGKATRALLALGRPVHALEPDPRMAAMLELNCGDSEVAVERQILEEALLPSEFYGLAVAAQTWHWVDPMVGYARVAEALVPHGRLALLWHHPQDNQGLLGEAIGQVYAALAPEMANIWPGMEFRHFDPPLEHVGASTRFRAWTTQEYRWLRRLDSLGLVGWLCSSSAHRLLPVSQRTELMAAVAVLVSELGGEVTVKMRTVAHLGVRV
jgi:SAM-dependent methyltransferase